MPITEQSEFDVVMLPMTSQQRRINVVLVSSVALSFISFWRAAAIVLNDMASTVYYIGDTVDDARCARASRARQRVLVRSDRAGSGSASCRSASSPVIGSDMTSLLRAPERLHPHLARALWTKPRVPGAAAAAAFLV